MTYAERRTGPGRYRALVTTALVHAGLGYLVIGMTGLVEVPLPVDPVTLIDTPPAEPAPPVSDPELPEPDPTYEAPVITIAEPVPLPLPPSPWVPDRLEMPAPPMPIPGPGPLPGPDARAEPLPSSPVVTEPKLDRAAFGQFQPPYPAASARRGEEGSVTVGVVVAADGRVRTASIVRSSGFPRLDEAAVRQAERRWRFTPAARDGVAIEGRAQVTVTFDLKDG